MRLTLHGEPTLRQERQPARRRRRREPDGWEFRRPEHWTVQGTAIPLFTVLTADELEARGRVYDLGHTTGDIDCGLIDLVPVYRPRRRKKR